MEQSKWKNLERIFIQLRFDIKNQNNSQIVDIVIRAINNNLSNFELCEMISCLMPTWKKQFIFNSIEQTEITCSKEIKLFMIKALDFMKNCLSNLQYDIAYDIADILQGLYGILLADSKKSLKQYWKIYIKPFQKKWNSDIFYNFKDTFVTCSHHLKK